MKSKPVKKVAPKPKVKAKAKKAAKPQRARGKVEASDSVLRWFKANVRPAPAVRGSV